MSFDSPSGLHGDPPELLWEDGEFRFCRAWRDGDDGSLREFTAVVPASENPAPNVVERLTREFGLRDYLEDEWALRPLEFVRERGRTLLLFEAARGLPLDRLPGRPREMRRSLRLAAAIAAALGRMHQRGLVHRDIKPSNILVDVEGERIWLTGFGIASRLVRERQSPEPPELIAGTLAYMAPEQTGRMNRSVDSRSDLYSFGVVLYQLVTASLPFGASDPMEWVHCHIARAPEPPEARAPDVPGPVSAIIMKLLVKTPEHRYQTAAGVEDDLRRCLADWEARGAIEAFPLGQNDHPNRLMIPEKLYGRDREIETLLSCFDEVVTTGISSLVLVAGYSGVGKSSVVNELHKALVPPRALFATGKFDQNQVETPYGTLAQALQTLTRGLLTKPEAELERLREALSAAVNPNGAVLVDLVPELELIIGAQPPVVELPAKEAQRRFQLLIQRFISVFARPEHPLALFLDDLQWLDAATLELLGELLGAGEVRHLLLIGAYRDNEVNEQHPLTNKLVELRRGGANVRTVILLPLEQGDLEDLLGDALRAPRAHLRPLAELALGKTGGNPFFLIQFLDSLAQEGLLAFDHQAGHWSWDHERTFAKSYTDNVVDLMLRKLGRLPAPTRQALMRLACLGNVAEHATLSAACDSSSEVVDSELWEALRHELLLRTESAYRFSHDRVQEAAYWLIPEPQRAALHLQIGRRLLERTPVERRKEAVFEIVNQLNRGGSLITLLEEREQLAELDLLAGKRAKTSTAYAAALEYLNAGLRWLPEDGWTRRRELTFSLLLARAECEYLTGDLAAAEQHLGALWAMDLAIVERAAVACLRIDLYVNLAQGGVAITAGLDYLRHVGIDWSARPTAEAVRNEYELVWATLGERPTETLSDLPLMRDRAHLGTLDVLITLTTPTWLVDPDLLFLVTCRAVNLSLTHGNADASCVAYVMFGALSGPRFGDYQAAHRFSLLAHRLGERPDLRRFRARTDLFFGYLVLSWKKHLRVAREALWRSNQDANQVGNLTFTAISSRHISSNMLTAGDPLEEVQRQIETSLAFATERQFWLVVFTIIPQLGFARTLRGLTPTFGSFDDDQIDVQKLELQLASNELFAVAECFH